MASAQQTIPDARPAEGASESPRAFARTNPAHRGQDTGLAGGPGYRAARGPRPSELAGGVHPFSKRVDRNRDAGSDAGGRNGGAGGDSLHQRKSSGSDSRTFG